ncbi:hypothetical protein [Microbacterium candidum]|uniref:DUF2142 domain-containing protein n=1 Tax=Microbacterium candidum TaxID=3041922 RepID=A0ABT7N0S6_9MICO|nr:hypothetical protein [Microbacterium sp. ASV49]MDL9980309.1 hypothetical protein [Microbacterium sp. ASV49]
MMTIAPSDSTRGRWHRLTVASAAAIRGERGFWRWLLALALVFLMMQAVFFTLVFAAASVPTSRIVNKLAWDASNSEWDARDFPQDGVGHRTPDIPWAGISDSFTECIALTLGVWANPADDSGPLSRAVANPHLGTCSTAYPGIKALAAGEPAEYGTTYARVWGGSNVVTRPMLAIGGVSAVRLASAVLLVAGFVVCAFAFARRSSIWLLVAVLAPVLLSTNILTQTLDSYPHVLTFSVALFGMAAGAALGRYPAPAIVIGAMAAGGLLNFVDFLLNPPLAWALFAFSAVATRAFSHGRDFRSLFAALGAGVGGWILGYGATWVAKWVIAVASYGQSALDEILSVVAFRIQGSYASVTPGLGQATSKNVMLWWSTIPLSRYVLAAAVAAAVIAAIILVVRHDFQGFWLAALAASPALLVLLWYELLSNHSQIHTWFTYRSVPAAVGILVAAVWLPVMARPHARMRADADRVRTLELENATA